MYKYKFSSQLLLRTPLYSPETLPENYSMLLQREDFTTAIFLASGVFYRELLKRGFSLDNLSVKERMTLLKYLNRATFRAIPFGLFSAVTLISWGEGAKEIFLEDMLKTDVKLDYSILYAVWQNHFQGGIGFDSLYRTNASLWNSPIDLRYIKRTVTGEETRFSLASTETNKLLTGLLEYCRLPKRWEELENFLTGRLSVTEEGIKKLISELIDEQIIESSLSPNITGEDFQNVLEQQPTAAGEVLKNINGQLKAVASLVDTPDLIEKSHAIDAQLDSTLQGNNYYCISNREIISGALDLHHQNSILEGLYCLSLLTSSTQNSDIETFKKAFKKKYEDREVPLLEVIDAQFGIGYGNLDTIQVNYGFMSSAAFDAKKGSVSNEKVAVDTFSLFESLQWQKECCFQMEITENQLKALKPKREPSDELPPSISVIFRTLGDQVFIESAGGTSALSLVARFCEEDDIYQYAQTIAKKEQQLNNEIIFAEIAHVCDLHIANINRRPHLYDYEIPVLTNSILEEERQIQLHDLWVSVTNNMVLLRSKRLNKLVIPRLSSAFNYTKNTLPLFRFLCDLQSQGMQTNFWFSLSASLPGLTFYPRLVYKSCILQLAEWHLNYQEIHSCIAGSYKEANGFDAWRRAKGLPCCFSIVQGDNFLMIDANQAMDVQLFLNEIKGKQKIVLREFPFKGEMSVKNRAGQPLIPQYVASLYRDSAVYTNGRLEEAGSSPSKPPGQDEWLYYKVYCHALSSEHILTRFLLPLIRKLKRRGHLSKWFWLRYDDPDYHLRLRIKIIPGERESSSIQLMHCMNKLCSLKLVSHFHTDVYWPESSRYSYELIEEVERVFEASSELISRWLLLSAGASYSDEHMLVKAVLSSAEILETFGIKSEAKAEFCKRVFENYFHEFGDPRQLKQEIEKLFKKIQSQLLEPARQPQTRTFRSLKKVINELLEKYHHKKIKRIPIENLVTDLLHMHMNRIFIYDQRYFEMVSYYLLYRSTKIKLYTSIKK